jgi:hypothetical protein
MRTSSRTLPELFPNFFPICSSSVQFKSFKVRVRLADFEKCTPLQRRSTSRSDRPGSGTPLPRPPPRNARSTPRTVPPVGSSRDESGVPFQRSTSSCRPFPPSPVPFHPGVFCPFCLVFSPSCPFLPTSLD